MIPDTGACGSRPCIGTGKDGDRAFGSPILFTGEFTATVTGTEQTAPFSILPAIGIRERPGGGS
jgi:hypothetical protein